MTSIPIPSSCGIVPEVRVRIPKSKPRIPITAMTSSMGRLSRRYPIAGIPEVYQDIARVVGREHT
jgi:hypothetical protein